MSDSPIPEKIQRWMPLFVESGCKYGVDPLLVASVCWRETRGENVTGDHGYGHGLMQVDSRFHPAFCSQVDRDGKYLCDEPGPNVDYGTAYLAELVVMFNGYVPAAVAAYNAGPGHVRKIMHAIPPDSDEATKMKALDSVTTGHSYAKEVCSTWNLYSPKGVST